jgi:hypothetical protein
MIIVYWVVYIVIDEYMNVSIWNRAKDEGLKVE